MHRAGRATKIALSKFNMGFAYAPSICRKKQQGKGMRGALIGLGAYKQSPQQVPFPLMIRFIVRLLSSCKSWKPERDCVAC